MNGEVVWKLTYRVGIFYYRKVASLVQVVSCASVATIFERDFELHHAVERHVSKCYEIMDPNGHRQWARPSLRVFILKELNAAECEGLACETILVPARPVPRFLFL